MYRPTRERSAGVFSRLVQSRGLSWYSFCRRFGVWYNLPIDVPQISCNLKDSWFLTFSSSLYDWGWTAIAFIFSPIRNFSNALYNVLAAVRNVFIADPCMFRYGSKEPEVPWSQLCELAASSPSPDWWISRIVAAHGCPCCFASWSHFSC